MTSWKIIQNELMNLGKKTIKVPNHVTFSTVSVHLKLLIFAIKYFKLHVQFSVISTPLLPPQRDRGRKLAPIAHPHYMSPPYWRKGNTAHQFQ